MRNYLVGLIAASMLGWSGAAGGAELTFDFGSMKEGQVPEGFQSLVSGQGKPGDWRVVLEEVAPLLSVSPKAPVLTKKAVLAQVARDGTDEHFPLLVYTNEIFGDFTLTTRFKLVEGKEEQMAGIAFRMQDENNYYYIRASALGNSFAFFRYEKGQRVFGPIGSKVEITKGEWHEMKIECKGIDINGYVDGKHLTGLHQSTFARGRIGFWTKSDSVSYFAETRLVYVPLVVPAQVFVREAMKKYPRVMDLRVYVPGSTPDTARLVASKDEVADSAPDDDGKATAVKAIRKAASYYGKEKGTVI